jgi:oxygen-independent coproporphyrinogen-3 oxidase
VSELPASSRIAVAGLIADGLVNGAAALEGRVELTLRGRLLADAVVRRLTELD